MSRQSTLADHTSTGVQPSSNGLIDLRDSLHGLPRFMASVIGDIDADRIVGPKNKILAAVHDAALLTAVDDPRIGISVELRRAPKYPTAFASESVLSRIQHSQAELRRQIDERGEPDGLKLSPDTLALYRNGVDRYVIDFHEERFSNARGFHKIVAEDSATFAQLALTAANFDDGQRWPGILCMHLACVIRHDDEPYLVLSQRFRAWGDGGYHAGAWSASIEEQMELDDIDAETGFHRAIAEELLGRLRPDDLAPRTLGVCIEQSILNTSILGYADLSVTFDELVAARRTAPDYEENRQIVAMPLRRELVMQCIENHALTEAVREACLVEDADSEVWTRNNEWDLHPTSAMRMLAALWVAQT